MNKIMGTKTSVHVGSFTNDFTNVSWRDSQQIPRYSLTGVATSVISGRVSWFFNLKGPSMTVDTACSSSLVALALSCNCLWAGESNIVTICCS